MNERELLKRLVELYKYDSETGLFLVLKRKSSNSPRAGTFYAGANDGRGYMQMRINGRQYKAHRLAWLAHYGSFPCGHIDHINGNKSDNRIANLRDVSQRTNNQNLRRAPKTSGTGRLGITPRGSRYRAQIRVNGKTVHLGYFSDADEAHSVYVAAKRKLHAGCTL